jgi:hypothetical protein
MLLYAFDIKNPYILPTQCIYETLNIIRIYFSLEILNDNWGIISNERVVYFKAFYQIWGH